MSDDEDKVAQYYYLQVHGRLVGDTPVCCVHITRQGEEDPLHTMILTLDQADALMVDLHNARDTALTAYIHRRSAFNELEADLRAWETLKPPDEPHE